MDKRKFIFICLIALIFTIFSFGCSKEEEKETSVSYINEHLNSSRYDNYTYDKKITYQTILLLEKKVTSSLINSEYVTITTEKTLSTESSGGVYKETTSEVRSKSIVNPITLNLKEEYFESVSPKEKSLTGKINPEYSLDVFGVTNIRNIKINILLNDNLKVEVIEITYIDNVTDYEVSMNVKYEYS